MRDELVRRRGWIDDAAFVDLLGASNLIPGPTSTELAIHIGHRRAGWPGLLVGGLSFVAPAVVIVAVLGWVYVTFGTLPAVEALLTGVGPVVVAIIAVAGLTIARTATRTPLGVAVAALAVVGSVARVSEIAVLLGLGLLVMVIRAGGPWVAAARDRVGGAALGLVLPPGSAPATLAFAEPWWLGFAFAVGPAGPSPVAVFGEFAKIGAVLFGSGYVLVALLRAELVQGLGWITEGQLIDAIAVGQATPGPLFSTATFIGYLVDGPVGAAAATVGIFLPAFVAVAVTIPILDRLSRSATFRAFLDGVNAAAVGLLAVVAAGLALSTLTDPLAVAIALAAGALLLRGLGTVWLIVAGAAIGLGRPLLQA
jgi:chromate transporter